MNLVKFVSRIRIKMKFYGPKKIIELERKRLYRDLRNIGFNRYRSKWILSEIYSLKGEFLFKPLRTGMTVWLMKKDLLSKEGFESYLEKLVG